MSAALRRDSSAREGESNAPRPSAETPDSAWWSAARDSGIVLVRRPAAAAPWPSTRLLALTAAVFTVGLSMGFVIGRATAPREVPVAPPARVAVRPTVAPPPPSRTLPVAREAAATSLRAEAPAPTHDAPPAVEGLTAAQVMAVQRAHVGRSRDCINRARRRHPDLAGTARITVLIESSGRVRNAVWTRAEPSQVRAVGCIADSIHAWRFPATGYAGEFIAVLPFDLRTGARPEP